LIREFHLSPPGWGVSCDADGAYIGAIPILDRLHKNGKDEWHPRDCSELSEQMGAYYGLPIDMSSKTSGLKTVAKALNDGDVARAQVATVLLGIPDPLPLSKDACSRDQMLKLIRDLHWSGMLKWDPDERPRWPAGSADSKGGEFAPKGGVETAASPTSQSNAGARIQLADDSISDASNDPIAEAAARTAAAAGRDARAANSEAKPVDNEHQNFWRALGSRISHEAKSALAQIGRAEIARDNANLATSTAQANTISHALRAYLDYRAQPWIGPGGRQIQISTIATGDPASDRAAFIAHELFAPDTPLMRPATNADWIDPLISMIFLGATAGGSALRRARPTAEALDGAELSTNVAEHAFETTESVTVNGSRAIDRGASYETGVRNLYRNVPLSERKFQGSVDGKSVTGLADNTTIIDGRPTAVEAKYVDAWAASLRNPASAAGGKPWGATEQQQMIRQAKAYSSGFPGGVIYHTNSADLAAFYTNVFRKAGVTNFQFVITPATKLSKSMTRNPMERIFGEGAFEYERKIAGTRPGEDQTVRYVYYEDPESPSELFDLVLNKISPPLTNAGGAVLEGTRLKTPDGRRFFAIVFHRDLEGWRKQIEQGAIELGRATARVLGGDVIVSDGRSYRLSSCEAEFD